LSPVFCWWLNALRRKAWIPCHFSDSPRLPSPREVAIVLVTGDCSLHIPSPSTAHDHRKQLCQLPRGRCGFIWCEFLAARATPSNATCCQAWTSTGSSRRIHGPHRVGPNGRDLTLPSGNGDRTTGRILASSVSFPLKHQLRTATIPWTWAEDRALLGSNPSAVPGANTEWGGTRPPSSIRDWHQGAKSRGLGRSPSMLLRDFPSGPQFSVMQPHVLGTRHRLFACSACAR
jgi:hypothetical protein